MSTSTLLRADPCRSQDTPPPPGLGERAVVETVGPSNGSPDSGERRRVRLMGVEFDACTEREAVDHVMLGLAAGRGGVVVTSNLDHLRRAQFDDEFREMVEAADVVTADGMPLVWASRVQRTPLPERVAGSSMVVSLARAAAEAGRSLYLLGGDPGAAEGAAAALTQQFPSLRIAGIDAPPHGFMKDHEAVAAVRQRLEAARPDIVYVALGSPKQERLIRDLRDAGTLPQAWWLGVGISLSFLAGMVHRAPHWMQAIGAEWIHRLTQEPGRLFKRYVVQGIPFGCRLMGGALARRVQRQDAKGPRRQEEAENDGSRAG